MDARETGKTLEGCGQTVQSVGCMIMLVVFVIVPGVLFLLGLLR